MKEFMDKNFILSNGTAIKLFNEHAKDMPIFDFHNHLSPKEIYEDRCYENIAEVWLGGDHYKWRIMRAYGIDEERITGSASWHDKFLAWAETLNAAIGNPLYHWSHLELKRYFGIEELLRPETAEDIWRRCNEMLSQREFSVRGLLKKQGVAVLCTTDDPADALEYHKLLSAEREAGTFDIMVRPSFRPDNALKIEKITFADYTKKLGCSSGIKISKLKDLEQALSSRLDYFIECGCMVSDHSIEEHIYCKAASEETASAAFMRRLSGEELSEEEISCYRGYMLTFLGREYARHNIVMQLHDGALRDNSTRMARRLGPDTGFDAMRDISVIQEISGLLNSLDMTDELPKTILYCLNPVLNNALISLMGCFQGGGVRGKLQFGPPWWFIDNKKGMENQLIDLANNGMLSTFVGMLTDSRSFLSFPRHEYFRRILCNVIGTWVENGEYPYDMGFLGNLTENICYNNAARYFGLIN